MACAPRGVAAEIPLPTFYWRKTCWRGGDTHTPECPRQFELPAIRSSSQVSSDFLVVTPWPPCAGCNSLRELVSHYSPRRLQLEFSAREPGRSPSSLLCSFQLS